MADSITRRPYIGTTLEPLRPGDRQGTYDPVRQVFVTSNGTPLLARGNAARAVRTFVEKDPAEPAPRPPQVPTRTKVVQEPADIVGFARIAAHRPDTLTRVVQDPADPHGSISRGLGVGSLADNLATGAVVF